MNRRMRLNEIQGDTLIATLMLPGKKRPPSLRDCTNFLVQGGMATTACDVPYVNPNLFGKGMAVTHSLRPIGLVYV